jgi:hypothetical protein
MSPVQWFGPPVAVAVVAGYAWWATGVAPFTAAAYVAVGIPVAVVALAASLDPRRDEAMAAPRSPATVRLGAAVPWAVLGGVALVLELVALGLGGRSHAVPTLSTVVDHALSRHPVRFVLFSAWLAVAGLPLVRRSLGCGPEPVPEPEGTD